MQPWKVYVVAGEARQRLIDAVSAKFDAAPDHDETRYPGYPPKLHEPYRTRRFALGEAMYSALDIPRERKDQRLAHLARNFQFFNAPVGVFFAMDERFEHFQFCYLGSFMMALTLAAEERGLSTCLQGIWQNIHQTAGELLDIPSTEKIVAGMALGYKDEHAAVNQLRSEREPVDAIARFEGFDTKDEETHAPAKEREPAFEQRARQSI